MKAVKVRLAGRERYLAFTVEAMFQIEERFGGAGKLLDALRDGGREGCAALCQAAAILAEQGELARRGLGYDPQPLTSEEEIQATLAPSDVAALKLLVPAAITLGYGREVEPENNEVDLGLAELNAKKPMTRAHYVRAGLMAGLSRNETLLSAPGEVEDLWELCHQAHRAGRRSGADEP